MFKGKALNSYVDCLCPMAGTAPALMLHTPQQMGSCAPGKHCGCLCIYLTSQSD